MVVIVVLVVGEYIFCLFWCDNLVEVMFGLVCLVMNGIVIVLWC